MLDILRISPAPESLLSFPVRIRLRDGVSLAGDVYLPGAPDSADATPGDTILIRLPYDKSGVYCFIPLIAEYFTRHGYRVVAQDVRGKFRSEGDALLFVNEVNDGYDTIEWITQQNWSNGRVAMWGDSYYGYTQWAAAASGHAALKAISPRVTGTELGEPVRRNGTGRTHAVEWGVTYMYPLTQFFDNDALHWEPDWSRRDFAAQAEEFMSQVGRRGLSYDQWYPNPVRLQRFPNGDPFGGRSVPVLHTIGWWDNCAPLSWADVDQIKRHPN
ncbi:CocE/NonD family hydrolase [Agromyces laixinhei]|uniref:CocE/NonD family hydrolase n=1 Tax=Agromyces laixinhei TaxID=2585717 RepID=UPI0011161D3A|nr:CocE/NonD family hydrolase [Agromyces laixinhei]